MAGRTAAQPRTFVYVSNAEDGDIGIYALEREGALVPRGRAPAGKLVGPLALSPDRRFLYAAVRSAPYSIQAYAIDRATGALRPVGATPVVQSFPYISLDRTGRYLFAASYGAHLVCLMAVGDDGRIAAQPLQVIPLGRNAHSIRVDASNRYVYVPALGSDQVFQFKFDAVARRLDSNTPAVALMQAGCGPRHFAISCDNRFLYLLSELQATVTAFALEQATGLLSEVASVSGLPAHSKLRPGTPRPPSGAPDPDPARDRANDIWAADIHLTPDGRFLYASERTSSTLAGFAVDGASLSYLGSTPTECQPRGFAIDPSGRFLIACGEKSTTLSVYAIDGASGALARLGSFPGGRGANWVEIVGCD